MVCVVIFLTRLIYNSPPGTIYPFPSVIFDLMMTGVVDLPSSSQQAINILFILLRSIRTMGFSVVSGTPMFFFFSLHAFGYALFDPELPEGTGVAGWEILGIFGMYRLVDAPAIENSQESIFLLAGMIQSGFLVNMLVILHVNYKVNILYARLMTLVFIFYLGMRMTNAQSILFPKLPLKFHKKSITIISIFFFSTGCYIFPYAPYQNLFLHFYIYLLCIETSILYYTQEFRLFVRFLKPEWTIFNKAYHFTVYRGAPVIPTNRNSPKKPRKNKNKKK